ncbi:MAG TPA: hypothetical protein VE974_14350 [Thermoanaerobaculia bacterium]|nr:hypothetical protein [Thermoanaerobaculia bacterium]
MKNALTRGSAKAAAAPTIPVSVFNSETGNIQVVVNNGASFIIPGTSTAIDFIPQMPPASVAPTFSFTGPAPNTFGPGLNFLTVTPVGTIVTKTLQLTLPTNAQYVSLQFYVFWNGVNAVSTIVLTNGQFLALLT